MHFISGAGHAPASTCNALTNNGGADTLMHCLVHADIVDFTSWSSSLPPDTVFATVNKLYSKLDAMAATVPCLYKVPPEQPTH